MDKNEKNTNAKLHQCLICGYLDGALVKGRECTSKSGRHRFKPLEKEIVAGALGAFGGRPPIYQTEEERIQARRNTWNKANAKRRQAKQERQALANEVA